MTIKTITEKITMVATHDIWDKASIMQKIVYSMVGTKIRVWYIEGPLTLYLLFIILLQNKAYAN